MAVKKKVNKKGAKKSSSGAKSKFKDMNFLDKKKTSALANFIRVLMAFVIFLVLYFVTSNTLLKDLFMVGALITGALALAFLLIFLGVFLYIRTHKK